MHVGGVRGTHGIAEDGRIHALYLPCPTQKIWGSGMKHFAQPWKSIPSSLTIAAHRVEVCMKHTTDSSQSPSTAMPANDLECAGNCWRTGCGSVSSWSTACRAPDWPESSRDWMGIHRGPVVDPCLTPSWIPSRPPWSPQNARGACELKAGTPVTVNLPQFPSNASLQHHTLNCRQ